MALRLLLLLPALVAQNQPTFYAAWEDGRDAERHGHWAAALAAYQRAVALRPTPAARVIIYGNNLLEGYYPYTRLARCNLELGRLDAAASALAQAEREGEPTGEGHALAQRLAALRPKEAPARDAHPRDAAPAAAPAGAVQAAPPPAPPPHPVPPPAPAQALTPAPVQTEPRLPVRQASAPPPSRAAEPAPVLPPPAAAPVPPPPVRQVPWGLLGLAAAAAAVGGAYLLGRRRPRPAADAPVFGPYRTERLLGRGGFASTYLARRDGDPSPVALKVLHPFRQDDPEFQARFRQEARLGALLDHPNIVRILDQGQAEDAPWLAMEYVEGRRLDAILRETSPLPLARVADIGLQVAEAMASAHARGIVHRDLKPANIMLVGTRVKVMDFGIARVVDAETLTTTYAFLGTPLYAAPELQTLTQVGPSADAYALGIILFEMLTGRPPFQGDTPFEILDQHRRAELPDPAPLRPGAPGPLVDLIRSLAGKDPGLRPDDARILAVLGALVRP